MTLEAILKMKLKTFLSRSFSGSVVTNDLKPGMIKFLIAKVLNKSFNLNTFTIKTTEDPSNVLLCCEQYYFERDWLIQSKQILNIDHNGSDLSFIRDEERLFLILSPFDGFIQITTAKFNKN